MAKSLLCFLLGLQASSTTDAWVSGRSSSRGSLVINRGQPLRATDETVDTAIAATSRRGFLTQASIAATATIAAPLVAWAEEEVTASEGSSTGDKKDENKDEIKTEKETEKVIVELEKDEKKLIAELKKDEKDEIKTEKETEKLISQLEEIKESGAEPTKAQEQETQKLIAQLEKDEEKVEGETLQLIENIEKIEANAEKAQVAVLPEPEAKTPKAAADASKAETKEFIDVLKSRSADNEEYLALLREQKTLKTDADKEKFLEKLKARAAADKEFLTDFDAFLDRLQSRFAS